MLRTGNPNALATRQCPISCSNTLASRSSANDTAATYALPCPTWFCRAGALVKTIKAAKTNHDGVK